MLRYVLTFVVYNIEDTVLLAAQRQQNVTYWQLDLGAATSVVEFWLGTNTEPRLKYKQKFI